MGQLNEKLRPINPSLIEIQNKVRSDFNWSLESDINSAKKLEKFVRKSPIKKHDINELKIKLSKAENVVILGAAVEPEDVLEIDYNCVFVAADGSIGVFDELPKKDAKDAWNRLALIVSDADGGDAILKAAQKGIPFALHAHGDNIEEWKKLLPHLITNNNEILLTHQCSEEIEGMHNPGGFTDGDRAACVVFSCGIPKSKIILLGFSSESIGRWTGVTNPIIKLRKLKWMDGVLKILFGVEH